MAGKTKMDKGVTLVASHTETVGDVRFADQLFVSGRVVGNVSSENDKATLIVGEDGFVSGEIRVPNVVINGKVEGNVFASVKVELANKAHVSGNLYYKLIEMQLGAVVDGQLIHENAVNGEQNGQGEGGA